MKRRRKSRAKNARPKGSYPLPSGGQVHAGKPITSSSGRILSVRAVYRAEPDIEKLAQIFFELAQEQHREGSTDDEDLRPK